MPFNVATKKKLLLGDRKKGGLKTLSSYSQPVATCPGLPYSTMLRKGALVFHLNLQASKPSLTTACNVFSYLWEVF